MVKYGLYLSALKSVSPLTKAWSMITHIYALGTKSLKALSTPSASLNPRGNQAFVGLDTLTLKFPVIIINISLTVMS